MSRSEPMDVDRESNGASSPPPAPQPQTSFSVPIPNGINTAVNGNGEDAPAPPPHKSNPSSPVPTAEDEAEAYKAAGNKFFKDKDYKNAIVQYSKGMCPLLFYRGQSPAAAVRPGCLLTCCQLSSSCPIPPPTSATVRPPTCPTRVTSLPSRTARAPSIWIPRTPRRSCAWPASTPASASRMRPC